MDTKENKMHIERENLSVLAQVTQVSDVAHGPVTCVFSSPELKAQVSYSDRPLSARLSVNFYIFDFFSRTTGPILTRLGTNHPWGRGFKFLQMKGITLL
jgi:hypothetical protein